MVFVLSITRSPFLSHGPGMRGVKSSFGAALPSGTIFEENQKLYQKLKEFNYSNDKVCFIALFPTYEKQYQIHILY